MIPEMMYTCIICKIHKLIDNINIVKYSLERKVVKWHHALYLGAETQIKLQ